MGPSVLGQQAGRQAIRVDIGPFAHLLADVARHLDVGQVVVRDVSAQEVVRSGDGSAQPVEVECAVDRVGSGRSAPARW